MKIVMLEPLGVTEETIREKAKPFIEAGHQLVYCDHVLTKEEKLERVKDAEALIIANGPLTADIINGAERLKMISVGFTGVDHVDLELCREKGIMVCNAQGYATDATGELAVALMLACLRNLVPCDQAVREGGTAAGYAGNTLKGKTVGIIGTGMIGKRVAALCQAFGCKVIGYSPRENQEGKAMGIQYKSLETVCKESDILTVHAPLSESTRHLIDKEHIDSMKKTAIFINCARGALVDNQALAEALNEGRIAKAGIDVFEMEPPIPADHPLLHAKNVIVTPHVGFLSEESLAARAEIVCDNIVSWIQGEPINRKA